MSKIWIRYRVVSQKLSTPVTEETITAITCQEAQKILAARYGVKYEEIVVFSFRSIG